jgi:hypothetical protein
LYSGSQNAKSYPSDIFYFSYAFESKLSTLRKTKKSAKGGLFAFISGKRGTEFEPVQGGFVSNH